MTQDQLEKAVKLYKKLEDVNKAITKLNDGDELCVEEEFSIYGSPPIYSTPEIITQIMYIYEVEKQRIEQEIEEL